MKEFFGPFLILNNDVTPCVPKSWFVYSYDSDNNGNFSNFKSYTKSYTNDSSGSVIESNLLSDTASSDIYALDENGKLIVFFTIDPNDTPDTKILCLKATNLSSHLINHLDGKPSKINRREILDKIKGYDEVSRVIGYDNIFVKQHFFRYKKFFL